MVLDDDEVLYHYNEPPAFKRLVGGDREHMKLATFCDCAVKWIELKSGHANTGPAKEFNNRVYDLLEPKNPLYLESISRFMVLVAMSQLDLQEPAPRDALPY
jgi:hypothetical protein